MHFYHALKRSPSPTCDGSPVVYIEWEDDAENELALRVKSEKRTMLIYTTDKIVERNDDGVIVVSIGASDHEFVL
jgi:hypothetical protein